MKFEDLKSYSILIKLQDSTKTLMGNGYLLNKMNSQRILGVIPMVKKSFVLNTGG